LRTDAIRYKHTGTYTTTGPGMMLALLLVPALDPVAAYGQTFYLCFCLRPGACCCVPSRSDHSLASCDSVQSGPLRFLITGTASCTMHTGTASPYRVSSWQNARCYTNFMSNPSYIRWLNSRSEFLSSLDTDAFSSTLHTIKSS
jgi:hypothetical protein